MTDVKKAKHKNKQKPQFQPIFPNNNNLDDQMKALCELYVCGFDCHFLTHFILICGLCSMCCTLLFQHLQQKGTDTWLWVHGHAFKVTECTWGGTLRSMLSPRAEANEYSANLHSTDAAEHQPYRMLSPLSPDNTHLLFLWAGFRNKCYEGSCGTVQTGCKLNREMAKTGKSSLEYSHYRNKLEHKFCIVHVFSFYWYYLCQLHWNKHIKMFNQKLQKVTKIHCNCQPVGIHNIYIFTIKTKCLFKWLFLKNKVWI